MISEPLGAYTPKAGSVKQIIKHVAKCLLHRSQTTHETKQSFAYQIHLALSKVFAAWRSLPCPLQGLFQRPLHFTKFLPPFTPRTFLTVLQSLYHYLRLEL